MRIASKLNIAVLAIMLAIFLQAALAAPSGMTLTSGIPQTKDFFVTTTITATGGATVNLNGSTETQTLVWQGFYGNVLGNVTLRDTSGDQLYSWNFTQKSGTVFATQATGVNFANITAYNDCNVDQNITGTGSDRVNLTFTPSSNTAFLIGDVTIAANTACRTNTYVNNATQTTRFEEIILTANGVTPIYATRIESAQTGFDGQPHDFQLIIPDKEDSNTTTYYVYAEMK